MPQFIIAFHIYLSIWQWNHIP